MMSSWRRAEQPNVSEPVQRERYSQELQRNIKATRNMEWMDVKDKVGLQTVCCPVGFRLSQAPASDLQLAAALQQVVMRATACKPTMCR